MMGVSMIYIFIFGFGCRATNLLFIPCNNELHKQLLVIGGTSQMQDGGPHKKSLVIVCEVTGHPACAHFFIFHVVVENMGNTQRSFWLLGDVSLSMRLFSLVWASAWHTSLRSSKNRMTQHISTFDHVSSRPVFLKQIIRPHITPSVSSPDNMTKEMIYVCPFYFFPVARQPIEGQGFSLTKLHDHTQTHHSVGLLWTSDQPLAEIST
jgi:hypothetical protein